MEPEYRFFPDHLNPMEPVSYRIPGPEPRDDRPGDVYLITWDEEGNWTESVARWDGTQIVTL